jgi:hypothetical protein
MCMQKLLQDTVVPIVYSTRAPGPCAGVRRVVMTTLNLFFNLFMEFTKKRRRASTCRETFLDAGTVAGSAGRAGRSGRGATVGTAEIGDAGHEHEQFSETRARTRETAAGQRERVQSREHGHRFAACRLPTISMDPPRVATRQPVRSRDRFLRVTGWYVLQVARSCATWRWMANSSGGPLLPCQLSARLKMAPLSLGPRAGTTQTRGGWGRSACSLQRGAGGRVMCIGAALEHSWGSSVHGHGTCMDAALDHSRGSSKLTWTRTTSRSDIGPQLACAALPSVKFPPPRSGARNALARLNHLCGPLWCLG